MVKAAGPDRRPPAPSSPQVHSSRFRAVLAMLPVIAGLLLLAVVIVFGWLTLQSLHGQPRYEVAFADIDCTPPPNLSRKDFLDDVQYIAHVPDSVCVLDDGLPARLSAAFAKHPWVEQVQSVEVNAPKRVHVRLTYRTAVLKVRMGDADMPVDRLGVRLPTAALDEGLPMLHGEVHPPTGQEGQPWGDEQVAGAARTAALFAPYPDRLHLETIEARPEGGLILTGRGWSAVWGATPGSEPLGEAGADAKVRRLLEFVERTPDGRIDLRPG